MKIHLDTDLGGDIDDLAALAYLLKRPDIEIIGITTSVEDAGKRAGYTDYALRLAGRSDIPLKAGIDVSEHNYRYKPTYEDETTMWGNPIKPKYSPSNEAIELLKKSILQRATVMAIGPYTNLAQVERQNPGILKTTKIVLMGGYIYPPEDGYVPWTNEFDYNMQLDIESSKYVIEQANPALVTLTECLKTAICRKDLLDLNKGDALAQLLYRQAVEFDRLWNNAEKFKQYTKVPRDIINFLYDPLACAIATEAVPYKLSKVPLNLEIKEGWLVQTPAAGGNVTQVVSAVNGEYFNQHWLKTVCK